MSQGFTTLKGRKVFILGLGLSGRSAAHFLLNSGAYVTGADRNAEQFVFDEEVAQLIKNGMKITHDSYPWDLKQFDLLVVSPGVSPQHPYYLAAGAAGIEIIGEAELACRSLSQPCLAVTGTNGKTTVSLLVAHALNQGGIKARAVGNIGVPLTSVLGNVSCGEKEIFVIELSSFQLDTLQSKFIDAGVILNITPDHLDRYADMEAYAKAKIHLGDLLKFSGKLFVELQCTQRFAPLLSKTSFRTYGFSSECFVRSDLYKVYCGHKEVFTLPEQYQGKSSHDLENIMAAFALCREAGLSGSEFLSALSTFKKPPHRIEFVRTVCGVHFYDDSKGTNIDAVAKAVDGMDGNVILIAGGLDKGASYTSWISSFAAKVKLICAIGKAAEKIKSDLEGSIPVQLFATLDSAVEHAAISATPGDIVLLSPGCSSLDMFRDYAHRGAEFQRLVRTL